MTDISTEYLPQSVLGCQTNFSFLRGASHPEEIMQTASMLGWQAIGIADLFGVGGLVRAWSASKDIARENNGRENIKNTTDRIITPRLISGARICLADGGDILCFVRSLDGYESLCQWLSAAMMRSGHQQRECPDLYISDLARLSGEACLVALPPAAMDNTWREQVRSMAQIAKGQVYIGGYLRRDGCDEQRLYQLKQQADTDGLELVALGDVLYHHPSRRPLADVLHCIREKTNLAQAGRTLSANAERHLLSPREMARRMPSVICSAPAKWQGDGRDMKMPCGLQMRWPIAVILRWKISVMPIPNMIIARLHIACLPRKNRDAAPLKNWPIKQKKAAINAIQMACRKRCKPI